MTTIGPPPALGVVSTPIFQYGDPFGTSRISGRIIGFTEGYIFKRGWIAKATVVLPSNRAFQSGPDIWTEFADQYETTHIEVAIVAWLEENCEHRWDRLTRYSVEFEDESDAVLFKFCWLP